MIKIMIGEIWKTAVYDGEPYEGYKVSNLGRILSLNYRNTGKAELMNPYEGFEVSNLGRIKSLNYRRTGRAELMNPWEDTCGYLRVELSKNGETKTCKVHRLVAQTFLPNPENKPCINHKIEGDKGKKINMVFFNEDGTIDKERTTIEWATYEENNNYATRNERIAKAISKAMTNGKLSKRVLQFTLDGEFIREWPSTREIERQLGFDNSAVGRCCLGKQKTHKGDCKTEIQGVV